MALSACARPSSRLGMSAKVTCRSLGIKLAQIRLPNHTRRSAVVVRALDTRTPEVFEEMPKVEIFAGNPSETHVPSTERQMEEAREKRRAEKKRERLVYQMSAIAASIGFTSMAVVATYVRFTWHMQDDGVLPLGEMCGTLALVAGGVYGMEMWARYAHKALWHDYAPGWALHKSHHEPRTGPFEANDLFAIINALPAFALCLYGFLTPGVLGGTCFGAGLGITMFGIMYMFVHDGLVHRRFPVGPIAELPVMKKLAVAHKLHHSVKYDGAPWGMFLALQELEPIPGAMKEVERMAAELDFSKAK
eukprot:gene3844-13906_t